MPDRVDALIDQWRRERPDLDPAVMGTVGRILRAGTFLGAELDRFAAEQGLGRGEADVLLTLRRAGKPYRLSPTALSRSLLVTPGGMTSRLDRLEREGLIRRLPDPDDRRAIEVELTPSARRKVDALLPHHIANEERLLAPLTKRDRAELDRLLGKLLGGLEG
ncbi:MAG TPA: MarR family transcriptional regulator [Solirubrobacterales bacterium]|nr:MarR family transcriptional regulator [Solirubrobacterales bacterium]